MSIIDDYDRDQECFGTLAKKVGQLIYELLNSQQIRVHSVTTRVKTRQSVQDKVLREPAKYADLQQITDVCGARIITYFDDEVDRIASIIETEFLIDRDNSIDKRAALDVDRFGYASVHYVVQLDERRATLSEYSRYAGMRFEIQIRSILQHAWAEIEHDLQYKSKESIPRELGRRFARLAGLLEIADVEFRGIRDALDEYRIRVGEEIKHQPGIVLIDRESLTLFVTQSETVRDVDQGVADAMGVPITLDVTNLDVVASMLTSIGLSSIIQVDNELLHSKDLVISFAAELRRRDTFKYGATFVGKGISLLYLAYILMTRENSVDAIRKLLDKLNLAIREGTQALAQELLETRASIEGRRPR